MTEQEYAQGAQVLCLLGAIVLYITALLIHNLPVHDHHCESCEAEKRADHMKNLEQMHRMWHRGLKYPGCPFCERP